MTEERTRPRPLLSSWLALLLSVISILGIVLALFGYGAALSVEGQFGMPHSAIFSSSLDLFNLGSWTVAQILLTGSPKLTTLSFYTDLLGRTLPITMSTVALAAGFALVAWGASRAWLRNRAAMLISVVRKRKRLATLIKLAGLVVALVAGTPLALVVGVMMIVGLCAALALIPAIGMAAGKSYIDDWVIRPTVCAPLQMREDRMAPPNGDPSKEKAFVASCVGVTRGTEQTGRGRVVFATSTAIILYNPLTGAVRRVSTDDSIVEVIDEL